MEADMRIRRNKKTVVAGTEVDRKPTARDYSSSAVTLSGLIGYRVVGGPWWAEFALGALAMLAVVLRIVFPQDSPDKLAFWRDLRLTRHRKQR
jgi:hypothetical protein